MVANKITLQAIHTLALAFCPREARWQHLLERSDSWGPAHELGHALVEPANRRDLEHYGGCAAGFCHCPGARCDVHEIAAMMISARLVRRAGHPELAAREIDDTEGYNLIDTPWHRERAKRRLRRLRLWPVPYTLPMLETALRRRGLKPAVGMDAGGRVQRSRSRMVGHIPSIGIQLFVSEIGIR